ncbi:MAG TPA: hypothetical protein VF363_02000 [Candidatus Eisenbacteria bacterium]
MNTNRRGWRDMLLSVLAMIGILGAGAMARAGEASSPAVDEAKAEKADLSEVRERAASMPIDRREDIDKRIAVTISRVNDDARSKGQVAIAARLAAEFSETSDALMDEKSDHGFSWGELVIAHTLLANSTRLVTLHDLATLRGDGYGWAAIAYGLRFHLEDFEDMIRAEGRVAMGLSRGEGKAGVGGK